MHECQMVTNTHCRGWCVFHVTSCSYYVCTCSVGSREACFWWASLLHCLNAISVDNASMTALLMMQCRDVYSPTPSLLLEDLYSNSTLLSILCMPMCTRNCIVHSVTEICYTFALCNHFCSCLPFLSCSTEPCYDATCYGAVPPWLPWPMSWPHLGKLSG